MDIKKELKDKITIYLPIELIVELKHMAIDSKKRFSELIQELIEKGKNK